MGRKTWNIHFVSPKDAKIILRIMHFSLPRNWLILITCTRCLGWPGKRRILENTQNTPYLFIRRAEFSFRSFLIWRIFLNFVKEIWQIAFFSPQRGKLINNKGNTCLKVSSRNVIAWSNTCTNLFLTQQQINCNVINCLRTKAARKIYIVNVSSSFFAYVCEWVSEWVSEWVQTHKCTHRPTCLAICNSLIECSKASTHARDKRPLKLSATAVGCDFEINIPSASQWYIRPSDCEPKFSSTFFCSGPTRMCTMCIAHTYIVCLCAGYCMLL